MSYLKINNVDVSNLVSGLKIGYEVLVSDKSGRNANGDTVIDIINRKVKVYATFTPMFDADMKKLLSAIKDYVVSITYRDSETGSNKTITCYCGTPEPEYYTIQDSKVLYKQMTLNFIQL